MIPTRFLLVAGMFSLAVLLYVDRICISTAKGPITAALKLSDEQFGWVLSSFALGYALFHLLQQSAAMLWALKIRFEFEFRLNSMTD